MAVSPNGQFVVSSGSDRVLRLYEKSDQILVLEDEQEEEREQEEALATGEQTVIPGQPGLNLPSKKTIGSEKAVRALLNETNVYPFNFPKNNFRLKVFWNIWKFVKNTRNN